MGVRNKPATKPVILKMHNVKLSFDIWLVLYYVLHTVLLTVSPFQGIWSSHGSYMNSCTQGLCYVLWSQSLDSLMGFLKDPVNSTLQSIQSNRDAQLSNWYCP